jgi:lipoprotein-releasing system permease protein
MYQFLLCWRYLKTRWLAFVCIISVMLGVSTLIVVNSVMNGFSTKLRDRLHHFLSDIVVEGHSLDGFAHSKDRMERIRQDPELGPLVAGITATVECPAMLQFRWPNGEMMTRMVKVVGIEPKSKSEVGGYKEFLTNEEYKRDPSFHIPKDIEERFRLNQEVMNFQMRQEIPQLPVNPDERPPLAPTPLVTTLPHGCIIGFQMGHIRRVNRETMETKDETLIRTGSEVILTTVGGERMVPIYDKFIVLDYFKSDLSEYDGNFVFVEMDHLQHLRTMFDRVNSIQVKLHDYERDKDAVKSALGRLFAADRVTVSTWEDKQGPLLRAIEIEKNILNILLFMIIAVAGFGILSIFSMIVAEKTRDIGILKALGASRGGVMNIFLTYGLLLGLLGAGFGTALGLTLTCNINAVEQLIGRMTGQRIFSGDVYYFAEIPTDIRPFAVVVVNIGAILVSVIFSILPALRAATLHPVQALRYD